MKAWLAFIWGWFVALLWRRSSTTTIVMRLVCGIFTAISLSGCMVPYSDEALHAMAPGADIVDVCVRMPTRQKNWVVAAYNSQLRKTTTNRDGDEFERAAKTADVIYRYDPNAPKDSPLRLPWPYNKMSCNSLSSWRAPSLPDKMEEISISEETREALVASLTQECGSAPQAQNVSNKQFMGQMVSPIGLGRTGHFKEAHWDEIKQTFRDAVKDFAEHGTAGHMPHMQEAKKEFWKDWPSTTATPLDSPKEQFVIGAIGGGVGAVAPAGVVVTQVMIDSGVMPEGSQEARLGKALAEIGIGGGKFFIGGDMTLVGGGMTLTGAGAVAGIPTCAAGISLATDGAITFCNGVKSLAIILCNWQERPVAEAQPLAAAAPKDAVSRAPPPQSGGASTSTTTPAAKPATTPAPANPAAKPNAPSGGQTPAAKPKRYGSGTKVSANTTTWVRCTGQKHHAISKTIHKALEDHKNLKGIYKARDDRFVTQAIDDAAHKGYQKWHRDLDDEIALWIRKTETATPTDFEAYLRRRYAEAELKAIFPNGL